MVRIPMPEAGREEAPPVVINDHGVVNNFILSIGIDVGDGKGVAAHAGVGGVGFAILSITGGGGVKDPARCQLAAAPVPGGQDGSAVNPAAHDHTGMDAIEVSDAGEEPIAPIAGRIIASIATDTAPG